jgi:hypothetical protein
MRSLPSGTQAIDGYEHQYAVGGIHCHLGDIVQR